MLPKSTNENSQNKKNIKIATGYLPEMDNIGGINLSEQIEKLKSNQSLNLNGSKN